MAEVQSWQRQNYAKNSGGERTGQMNKKISGNCITSMHSKIAKPTVQNYADGGEVSDGEWARTENYGDGTTGDERVAMARDPEYQEPVKVEAVAEPKVESTPIKQTFKQAFAENRKAGNATFEFNGKKFTTEVATGRQAPTMQAKRAESSSPASAPAPSTGGKSIMFQDKSAQAAPKSLAFDPDKIGNFGPRPEPVKERTFRQTRGGRIYDDQLPPKEEPKPRVHPRTGRPV